MSRDINPRGGHWLGQGDDAVAAAIDRRRPVVCQVERDWCTLAGALELARRIECFWAEHGGRTVVCRVERIGFCGEALPAKLGGKGLAVVRSDLGRLSLFGSGAPWAKL